MVCTRICTPMTRRYAGSAILWRLSPSWSAWAHASAMSTAGSSNYRPQLNTAKTEALCCASSRQQHLISNVQLLVCADNIKPGKYIRDHEIYIDSDTSKNTHVSRTGPAALHPCVTYAASAAPSLSARLRLIVRCTRLITA